MTENRYSTGPIDAGGCVFDDFRLTSHLPPEQAPAVIERDRLIMAARPGFERKLLPLRIEQNTGEVYSGGRYLFDTFENAEAFSGWCRNDFALDGVLILERPDFADVRAEVYRVIGAHDYRDIHTSQFALRTEIWKCENSGTGDRLLNLWPSLRDRAGEEGKSSLWLLHNARAGEIALVTVVDRAGDRPGPDLDYRTLEGLERAASYGGGWHWAEKLFDRSHWVYTVWFPNTGDTESKPPLWPNSPPLPAPQPAAAESSAA